MGLVIGNGSANVNAVKAKVGTGSDCVDALKIVAGTGSGYVTIWSGGISAVGMDKSGTQTYTAGGSYQQVTGFATRSGWGAPTGNTLVATAAGVVVIEGSLNLGTGYLEKSVQIKQNGNIVWTTPKAFVTTPMPFLFHANASAGDVFTMEAYCNISNEVIQPTDTWMTMKEQVFALTTTHTDDFNRANADLTATAVWEQCGATASTRPQIVSNQVKGAGTTNTRAYYATPPSTSTYKTFFKIDVIGIGTRVGVAFAATSGSGRPMSYVSLESATSVALAEHGSTTSSNAGTVNSTITVPTVTPPKELLVMRTSDVTADIFIDRVYIGTYRFSMGSGGYCGGVYTQSATDIIDNYAQGTWT